MRSARHALCSRPSFETKLLRSTRESIGISFDTVPVRETVSFETISDSWFGIEPEIHMGSISYSRTVEPMGTYRGKGLGDPLECFVRCAKKRNEAIEDTSNEKDRGRLSTRTSASRAFRPGSGDGDGKQGSTDSSTKDGPFGVFVSGVIFGEGRNDERCMTRTKPLEMPRSLPRITMEKGCFDRTL